jgi:hypothetical protein
MKVDDVIAAYMKLRDKKESMEAAVKEQTKTLKEQMEKLEAWIKEQASKGEQSLSAYMISLAKKEYENNQKMF